jgi:2,5-furandicarboxylate decarboxylase 1
MLIQEDLRCFLDYLKRKNRLVEIEEALSLQEISNLVFEKRKQSSTYLIEHVHGFQHTVCFNLLSSRDSFYDLLQGSAGTFWNRYLECIEYPIAPEVSSFGPVQENILTGPKVRLSKLPILTYSSGDAGPYVTSGIVYAKDPVTGIRNVSIHRMQVQGERQLGIRLEPGCHLEKIRIHAESIGTRLDLAISIGNHPAELMAAVSSSPFGVDELGIAGAMRGEPLKLVQCTTVDAQVPACSEIALEGYMKPSETALEGPFGDFMEYYVPPCHNYVVHIEAITQRNDAIFQALRAGSKEDSLLLALSREASIFDALWKKGIDVVDVNLSPIAFVGVLVLNTGNKQEVRRALEIALSRVSWLKYCIAVNPDVNPCKNRSRRSMPGRLIISQAKITRGAN